MDLRSGIPFWLATNGLLADFPTLDHSLDGEEVVIIGSGISGALAAYELCNAGFHCTLIDKRMLSSGSTWASTAQINYEIDNSLTDLTRRYGEEKAAATYQASLQAVTRLQEIFQETGIDATFEAKDSLYLASNKKGLRELEAEHKLRAKHGLPVDFLGKDDLLASYGIQGREGALHHTHAAQLDAYRAAAGLILYQVEKGNLTVYTRTAITGCQTGEEGVVLTTEHGHTIEAKKVVCAPGYEARQFLPAGVQYQLVSTYALATAPLPDEVFWKDGCQIWETARPYFYVRTTADNRIIMGGEDAPFKNPALREAARAQKTEKLLKNFSALFPQIEVTSDFSWAGTFSFTEDGLPYIGAYPGMPNLYFALGYGGNGTTFSMIAAEIITNELLGKPDPRQALFAFDR